MKGDHPERKNSKKESMEVEGNISQPHVVCFVCFVGVHRQGPRTLI